MLHVTIVPFIFLQGCANFKQFFNDRMYTNISVCNDKCPLIHLMSIFAWIIAQVSFVAHKSTSTVGDAAASIHAAETTLAMYKER